MVRFGHFSTTKQLNLKTFAHFKFQSVSILTIKSRKHTLTEVKNEPLIKRFSKVRVYNGSLIYFLFVLKRCHRHYARFSGTAAGNRAWLSRQRSQR